MNRQILRLAIPNILSNLSVPLLGIADTALMGHLGSADYLGAIALGGVLFNIIYWGFGFLRMGTTGMTAQAYGAENSTEGANVLARAMTVALLGSFILLLLKTPIADLGFLLMKGEHHIVELANSYFEIRIWAAPATLCLYALQGWLLGMQNARYPLYLTLLTNGLNVGLNFLFVMHFGMKADGVALATVIAQYSGLVFALMLIWHKYRQHIPFLQRREVFKPHALRRFFLLNRDIFIRTMLLVFTFSFFTSASAGLGTETLAINQILLQLFYVMSYGVDGFAFAAESLVGRFIGASDKVQLKQSLKLLLLWGMGLGCSFALLWLGAGVKLLHIFTNQMVLINGAKPYLYWLTAVSLAGAGAFIWDGVYIGATATKAMRNTMVLSVLLFFLPTWFLGKDSMGNHALWLAMLLFMLSRTVLLTLIAPGQILKTKS